MKHFDRRAELGRIPGFLRFEARIARETLEERWQRYVLLRATLGKGAYIDRRAVITQDGSGRIVMGQKASIGPYVYVCAIDGGSLLIGDDVYINEFDNIRAAGGDITIGSKTIIAQYVSIIASNHRIPGRDEVIRDSGMEQARRGVRIGRGVWIAANAVILPGVEIGDGAVVGAGAVVTKAVPPYAVVVGNPARVFRYR